MPSLGVSVALEGFEAVMKQIQAASESKINAIRNEVNMAALEVQSQARENCPVDTGRLRSSIRVRFGDGGMAADIYTEVEYAPYIEFGTGPAAGHLPFHPPPAALDGWLRRHGIDPALDFIIAQKIGSTGYAPHPFLGPAWESAKEQFLAHVQSILNEW